MRPFAITLTIIAAVVAMNGCARRSSGAAEPRVAAPSDLEAAVKATIEQWRQAYEVRSIDALAKLYAQEPELVVVQEGVAVIGWGAVNAAINDRLAKTTGIVIRLRDLQVSSLAPEVAFVVAKMTRELQDRATTITENGTVTMVVRKTADRWVIAAEHFSYKRS